MTATTTVQELAFFKKRPTSSMPTRKYAIQCVRTCTECVNLKTELDLNETILGIKSFDNLITRKALWFKSYDTIQYHVGQFEILSQRLSTHYNKLAIFVVALTRPSDIRFLEMVLESVQLPEHQREIVLVPLISCVDESGYRNEEESLKSLHSQTLQILHQTDRNPLIVPITITKDHDIKFKLVGMGSICVQLLEPYPMQDYTKAISTFPKHLYSDLILNSVLLPSHLVAFIVLYASPIDVGDIASHVDWFRKSSIDLDMQIGFTGESKAAANFGLIILKNFVQPATKHSYTPRNYEALFTYANMVAPFLIYQGIIARAILIAHNECSATYHADFCADVRVRVMMEKVREKSYMMAETISSTLSAQKPCIPFRNQVENNLDRMQRYGHYFRIEEPKIVSRQVRPWADDNSDDEYFQRNSDNPALKSWLILTNNAKKLNRLNMLINAVEDYL